MTSRAYYMRKKGGLDDKILEEGKRGSKQQVIGLLKGKSLTSGHPTLRAGT